MSILSGNEADIDEGTYSVCGLNPKSGAGKVDRGPEAEHIALPREPVRILAEHGEPARTKHARFYTDLSTRRLAAVVAESPKPASYA